MKRRISACGAGLTLCLALTAHAAVLTDAQDVPSAVISTPRSTPFLDPGDISNPGFALYLDELTYVSPLPAEAVFSADPSGTSTEYVVDQSIFNVSGQAWIGFRVELGFGTGAGFTPSTGSDGLDFTLVDSMDFFDSTHWALIQHTPDLLQWGSGFFTTGTEFLRFTFSVPDLGDSAYTFTVRQTPLLAPEPASLGVMLLGVGWVMRRRSRRC